VTTGIPVHPPGSDQRQFGPKPVIPIYSSTKRVNFSRWSNCWQQLVPDFSDWKFELKDRFADRATELPETQTWNQEVVSSWSTCDDQSKVKVTGHGNVEDPTLSRIRLTDVGKAVSLTHQPHSTPQKHYFVLLVLISAGGWLNPWYSGLKPNASNAMLPRAPRWLG
jgi:hypothetical protein